METFPCWKGSVKTVGDKASLGGFKDQFGNLNIARTSFSNNNNHSVYRNHSPKACHCTV